MVDNTPLTSQLENWFAQPLGATVIAMEHAELAAVLPAMFGYHLLQFGTLIKDSCLATSPINHRIFLNNQPGLAQDRISLCSSYESLPFRGDSVDVAILPHILEYEPNPQQVIHEAWRVLIPEGSLIIFCFNANSLWRLSQFLPHHREIVPWCGRFLATYKIRQWLVDLGCEIVTSKTIFFRPPILQMNILKKLNFMEELGQRYWSFFGGVSCIVAKKKVVTLTPLRARWDPAPVLVPEGLEPTARRMQLD